MSDEDAVLYAEVPGFYAEVERRDHPALAGRPVVVGGDPRKRGRVQSASPEARAAGVVDEMPMSEALERCPQAVRMKTDVKRYREASGALVVCLRRVVEAVEPAGFGAAYAEVRGRGEAPEALARRVVEVVRDELRLPLRVGVAPSKLLARLAAETAEASGVRRVRHAEVPAFLGPLPVSVLPRVGRKTAARLGELGVRTVGELRALDRAALEQTLGDHGVAIHELASGLDRSPVRVRPHPSTVSRVQTLGGSDRAACSACLRSLSAALEVELVRQGLRARRVALRARMADESTTTRSTTLGDPVGTSGAIAEVAEALFERLRASPEDIRGLALTLAGLVVTGGEDRQLELFPPDGG